MSWLPAIVRWVRFLPQQFVLKKKPRIELTEVHGHFHQKSRSMIYDSPVGTISNGPMPAKARPKELPILISAHGTRKLVKSFHGTFYTVSASFFCASSGVVGPWN